MRLKAGFPVNMIGVLSYMQRILSFDRRIMRTVKVSSKFQVVIPKEVREKLKVRAGQKLQVILYLDRIVLIPQRNIREMKGFLRGMDTQVQRVIPAKVIFIDPRQRTGIQGEGKGGFRCRLAVLI